MMHNLVKRFRIFVLFFVIYFSAYNCGGKPQSTANGSAPESTPVIDNSETTVSMMTQEYDKSNIAEIPMISYDGKNPVIEMLNNDIKQGIQQKYNSFVNAPEDDMWIEIKTYPFTDKRMIQLIITDIIYPNYGTDGDIVSYNFDKDNNEWISVAIALERLDIDNKFVEKGVKRLFVPSNEEEQVDNIEIAGFRYIDSNTTEFFLKIAVINPSADPYDGIFIYTYSPQKQTLTRFDIKHFLNSSHQPDKMTPPLYYGRQ